jgi:uncharacterized membrane protein
MLIMHFIGLAMAVGVGFTHMFLGSSISKMNKEESRKFLSQISVLDLMGRIGLGLLIISGGFLILPHIDSLTGIDFISIKLILVVLMIIFIVLIHNLKKKKTVINEEVSNKNIAILGAVLQIMGIIVILLSVFSFR